MRSMTKTCCDRSELIAHPTPQASHHTVAAVTLIPLLLNLLVARQIELPAGMAITSYQQVKRLNQMLPAIAVILWCNLLAVLANGYLKVLSIDAPAKRRQARWGLVGVSVLTLGLASWQTAEVIHKGYEVQEKLERAEKPYRPLWRTRGLPSERSAGARPNQNLP